MSLGWGLGTLFLLTVLSAFFSGAETAITSMGKLRLQTLAKEYPAKRKALKALIEEPNNMITSILIANNFVNLLASSIATVLSIQALPGLTKAEAGMIATVLLVIYLLIFGEISPKNLAKNNSEKITLKVINLLFGFSKLIRPLTILFQKISQILLKVMPHQYRNPEQIQVSEDQLKMLLEISEERGLLDEEEGEMIRRILSYDDMAVHQVMVPRTDVVAIEIDTPLSEVLDIVAKEGFSRYPIYENNKDNIIGILYAKDLLLLKGEQNLKDILRSPFFTPTTKPISDLLGEFKKNKTHIAIVVDEYGGMAGIITLEDILEEIVGEIEDEYDKPERLIQKVAEGEFVVEGDTEVDRINEELGINLPLDEGVTISGLLLHRLESIPKTGESITVNTSSSYVYITVTEATEQKIVKVKIEVRKKLKNKE
jgi:putative hemolysin